MKSLTPRSRNTAWRRWWISVGLLTLALLLTAAPATTVAAQAPAQAPNQEQDKSATATWDVGELPQSPIELAEKAGTAIKLSLKDITKLALQNNLDIAISDTNEELYQKKLLQTYGPYDPAITGTLTTRSNKSPNTRVDTAAAGQTFSKTDTALWNFQFTQALPTGGGITANFNNTRTDSTQSFQLGSPQYSPSLNAQITQPLWRNRRIDTNRGNIRLANLDLKTNDSQFKQKVNDTVSSIQSQYWDLVSAIRDYEIKRESVKLARITLRDNTKKVEIGTLAPIGVTEAKAEVANREVDLISSEERINQVENALRALVSNDRNAQIWRQTIIPTETPEFKEYRVLLEDAINTALQNRPELEQLAIKVQQNDVSYMLGRNQSRYQVDLVGGFGAVGSGIAASKTTPPALEGGLGHAWKTLFTDGFTNWIVGFQVQIPLRNRNVEAQLGQLAVQKRQLLMNRKSLEQQIQADVRNAVQRLETTRKQVETARVATQLAKEQLDGEEKRFQAGLSENFRVLDRQRGLSQAQAAELNALIAYKKAVITLQKAIYTLLESNDFEIAKTSAESVATLK